MLAAFVAVAASGPVNALSRRLPRGLAIAIVYVGIILTPILIALILLPPLIDQMVKLVNNLPQYVQDRSREFDKNPQLNQLNQDYNVTDKLNSLAGDAVSKFGKAAGTLASIGTGVVSSLFQLITILVLSIFMVGRGREWRDALVAQRPPDQAERLRRATDRIAAAVGGYVAARSRRPRSPGWSPSSCSPSSGCRRRSRSR